MVTTVKRKILKGDIVQYYHPTLRKWVRRRVIDLVSDNLSLDMGSGNVAQVNRNRIGKHWRRNYMEENII